MFTCQNASCKKTFKTPLKALNLQDNPTEPYFACPFCLTKIETDQTIKATVTVEKPHPEETKPKAQPESRSSKEEKPSGCRHYPGYLSERASKEQIPDECLVCKSIVDCMLKKMRS